MIFSNREIFDKLRSSTVGIAGLGGIGSNVAFCLARSGVGHLILVDFDIVESSNLLRQQYFKDQIGTPKVFALKENILRIRDDIRLSCYNLKLIPENISNIFKDVDIAIEALDKAEEKAMFVEKFRLTFPNKPIIAVSGIAGIGSGEAIVTRRISDNFFIVGDERSEQNEENLLWATRVGIASSKQAHTALRLLLGLDPF